MDESSFILNGNKDKLFIWAFIPLHYQIVGMLASSFNIHAWQIITSLLGLRLL